MELLQVFDDNKNMLDEFSFDEISALEKEAIGFNLKYNIFIKYNNYRSKHHTAFLENLRENELVYVVAMGRRVRRIKTKKNEDMAFMVISDETKELDAVIFPNVYQKYKNELEDDKVYIIKGSLSISKEKESFVISDLKQLKI